MISIVCLTDCVLLSLELYKYGNVLQSSTNTCMCIYVVHVDVNVYPLREEIRNNVVQQYQVLTKYI